ncbi:MAG: hypothetical protein NT002_03455 [candidate division Zixibacteria bacterium]|nr:hypothetical protein [candidate division Zixibacteria bacterium]
MKQFQYVTVLLLLTLGAIVASSIPTIAWLPCYDSFVFMGRTEGDTCTLAFMAVTEGECENWHIYYLTLSSQGVIAEHKTAVPDGPTVPIWDKALTVGDTLAFMHYLSQVNGVFIVNFTTDTVRSPVYDTAFSRLWAEADAVGNQSAQHRLLAENFDDPYFNLKAKLIWRYPGGLYKNYYIEEVIRTGHYAFIRTRGTYPKDEETHNGVLIYWLE